MPDGLQYSSQDYVLLMEKGSVQQRGFDRALYIADRLNADHDCTEQESKAKLDAFD